jgi:hypothetical protein
MSSQMIFEFLLWKAMMELLGMIGLRNTVLF